MHVKQYVRAKPAHVVLQSKILLQESMLRKLQVFSVAGFNRHCCSLGYQSMLHCAVKCVKWSQ
ncbi:hypothetical protein PSP6_210049 [Paraburkholderia tropica]|nr:hypothetical protein PSP6_210049 [Paraburkholderia tropica]